MSYVLDHSLSVILSSQSLAVVDLKKNLGLDKRLDKDETRNTFGLVPFPSFLEHSKTQYQKYTDNA